MSRERNGKFAKGFSGNPKGRPRKKLTAPTETERRKDFLRVLEETHSVPVNGKTVKMRAIDVINRQLVTKAMKGDTRCALQVVQMQKDIVSRWTHEKNKLLGLVSKIEKQHRDYPESITEEMLDLLEQCRRMIDDPEDLN